MATLEVLYSQLDSALRNRITAAGWNKAQDIVMDAGSTPTQLKYAQRLLTHCSNEAIAIGVLVLTQDTDPLTNEAIQTAVGQVVDKFAALEA